MPSFATGSPFDYELKKSLIVDSLKLLCMTPARRKMLRDERREMYAKRLTTNTKSMNAAQIAALQKEAGGAEIPAKSGPGELERRIKALLKKKEKNEREAKRKERQLIRDRDEKKARTAGTQNEKKRGNKNSQYVKIFPLLNYKQEQFVDDNYNKEEAKLKELIQQVKE